ncbi:uncharacterized protein LOC124151242 [Haliotis rufescens]|uniref:uncharacterized protein LOC124151242 n=1 Tax=Haliotis rufescens TaxID=6454 RepID=UPI001EB00D7D|nr:uncharacterized protein LOC124151242 [Haliotis rufescens]
MFSLLFLYTLAQTATSETNHGLATKDSNRDEIRCKENTIPIVSNIITSEDMETVFVIYEDELDACVNALSDSLSHHIKIQYTKPDALSRQIISVIDELAKKENIEMMRRTLNFVIICSAKCIQYSLAMGRELDAKVGRKSVMRHFSKWIALPSDDRTILVQNQTFDNIVLLSQSQASVIERDL